uniref:Polygalacturonase n=1 Tax=Cannabis sativa TaxID=3483 RepID=A0A803QI29_CANSA
MDLKRNTIDAIIALLVFLMISVSVNSLTFDVTKYGGKQNSDISQALAVAWKDACAAPSSAKIVIPKGLYKLRKGYFMGPCKSPIEFELEGTLQAPSTANGFQKGDGWVTFERINKLSVYGSGTFDGQGKNSWGTQCARTNYCGQLPVNIRLNYVTNSVIKSVTSLNSKQFHYIVYGGENLSFKNVKIIAPEDSWTTDGIHIGRSTNITVTDSIIKTGDDCISIGDGTKKLTITRVTCGPGHGISVGSLGRYNNELPVQSIYVRDCTFKGSTNGVRIKTWQGSQDSIATDMHFENLMMYNVQNPIIIDQEYCPWNTCNNVKEKPSRVKLSKVSFKNIRGTSATAVGVKLICGGYSCQNVEISGIDLKYNGNGPTKSVCKNVKPMALSNAWKQACASPTQSELRIPKGTFKLKRATLNGPCKAPIKINLQGTLQAPSDPAGFKDGDGWVTFERIDKLTLMGGGSFDGQGKGVWGKHCSQGQYCSKLPINVRFDYVTNSIIQDVISRDSKQFHINVLGGQNITFSRVRVDAPEDSANTDGIHIGRSNGVNIIDSIIQTGDDCVSLGDGSKQITVRNVTCGPGHGFSIGSLGKYKDEKPVEGVLFKGCTMKNTMNGVRIKTWPDSTDGLASNMHFEDINMENVGNPILIDQEYCPWNNCNKKVPSKIKLSNVSFKNIHGTTTSSIAINLICSSGYPCQNVAVENIDLKYNGPEGRITSQCKNVKPKTIGKQNPPPCIAI